MRRNRKRQVHAKVLPPSVAGMVVLIVSMVLSYWFMDAKCAQLGQDIRKNEQKYAAFEDECVREEARWSEKKTPEKLEQAMLQHGIAMSYPTADQVVRMDASGQPVAGQLSLVRFQRNLSASERVAKTEQK
ncbi:MAG TPA: hypothetical protein PKM57_08240 [Kiritimatiellia bacterium]|nr:hypothetical protein [Kiritimatiellia bacterium]HPS06663.1 hypothetical protein [Kiritimatiellia bacterium]